MIISLFPHERCCCCLNVFIRDTHLSQLFLKRRARPWLVLAGFCCFSSDFISGFPLWNLSRCSTSQNSYYTLDLLWYSIWALMCCCITLHNRIWLTDGWQWMFTWPLTSPKATTMTVNSISLIHWSAGLTWHCWYHRVGLTSCLYSMTSWTSCISQHCWCIMARTWSNLQPQ